jgi:hypothetical protein
MPRAAVTGGSVKRPIMPRAIPRGGSVKRPMMPRAILTDDSQKANDAQGSPNR